MQRTGTWVRTVIVISIILAAASLGSAQSPAQPSAAPATPEAQLQVCCRSLSKWASSGNWVFRVLNQGIIQHLHHCYVDFPAGVVVPGIDVPVQTAGIHPMEPGNNNKRPILDQSADNSDRGGFCKKVTDATPEKITRLAAELATGTCNSCGPDYHNRPFTKCFNNSNTYIYELVRGAGMTPPPMAGAPGYRPHHECGRAPTKGPQP